MGSRSYEDGELTLNRLRSEVFSGSLRVVFIGMAVCMMANAQGREYGRSMVISQQGIVATSQVLASETGAQILSRGGSAVDAAIAANAVLAVTEPMMDGL